MSHRFRCTSKSVGVRAGSARSATETARRLSASVQTTHYQDEIQPDLVNLEDVVDFHLDRENGEIESNEGQIFEQLKVSGPELWPGRSETNVRVSLRLVTRHWTTSGGRQDYQSRASTNDVLRSILAFAVSHFAFLRFVGDVGGLLVGPEGTSLMHTKKEHGRHRTSQAPHSWGPATHDGLHSAATLQPRLTSVCRSRSHTHLAASSTYSAAPSGPIICTEAVSIAAQGPQVAY